MQKLEFSGIHHLTAVTARAKENLSFYTDTLGLRLVKKTVNQDDVSSYHLFYADGRGTAGTDITFFDWPAARERRGTRSVVRTALRVSGEGTLRWWAEHLTSRGISVKEPAIIDGRLSLPFDDPEGQRLMLVDDGGTGNSYPWEKSPVPAEYQIRGLGPITLSVPNLVPTELVLTQVMNMTRDRTYDYPDKPGRDVHVYTMGPGGPAAEVHVVEEPHTVPSRLGAGGVHHVAFRTPNNEQLTQWKDRVTEAGIRNSGEVERFYFRSLYFREPNGILFEVATDGPGFDADESLDTLGETLSLPPFLEHRRESIEAGLKPI